MFVKSVQMCHVHTIFLYGPSFVRFTVNLNKPKPRILVTKNTIQRDLLKSFSGTSFY